MTNPSRPLDVANELAYRSGDAKLDFVDSSRENFRYREIAVLVSVLRRRHRCATPGLRQRITLPNSSRALCRRRFFSVSLVYETGPGPGSRQRTGPGLRAGGAVVSESALVARRRKIDHRPRVCVNGSGCQRSAIVVVSWLGGRRRCPNRSWSSIGRNRARCGRVPSCQLFVIGDRPVFTTS
jgi:hypothetical protein